MLFGNLALIFATLFAGAAFYIGFAEHPARLRLDPNSLLKQWAPSYKRGFIMQSSLAILSGVSAFCAYYLTQNWIWIAGALFILANWPYTLLAIMPTNHKLTAVKDGAAGAEEVKLLIYWGKLHSVRTMLSFVAVLIFLFALSNN